MERPMNTAAKDRTVQATIVDYIKSSDKRHTPVSRVKVVKGKDGLVDVQVYTSKPDILRMESGELQSLLTEESATTKEIKVSVVAEARAIAKYVRMSPRKVRFVIAAIKGKRVSEALDILRFIPNHASEPLTKVILSAAANAQESWGAGPDELKVANIIADGGPILKRIRARAQGRAYRILKRTSHITAILLETPPPVRKPRKPLKAKTKAPQPARAPKAQSVVAEPVVEEQTIPAVPVVEETSASAPETVVEQTAAVEASPAAEEVSGEEPQESTAETPEAATDSAPESGDAAGEKA